MNSEQTALLQIKEGFKSASDPFSSWAAEEDCRKWRGVGRDNKNGHLTCNNAPHIFLFEIITFLFHIVDGP